MATHSLNPDKNHRTMKKAKRKLDLRIKAYEEAVKRGDQRAYTKPGSMKMHS